MLNYKVAHVFDKTEPIQYNNRVFLLKDIIVHAVAYSQSELKTDIK